MRALGLMGLAVNLPKDKRTHGENNPSENGAADSNKIHDEILGWVEGSQDAPL
jgi:hypothetical protein